VRLFTRNGHDWTDRYPPIVEAALRNRSSSFVIDGEAVLLGVDGISDFDGLHSRKFDPVRHAMLEGLVSKHRGRAYRTGRSPNGVKVKTPNHPAMTRVMEAFYGKRPRFG
jgi:ATP-dependent DNA ligase